MSPADRRFWELAHRRVAGLNPDVVSALLRAFAILRESLTDAELQRAIDTGSVESLIRAAFSDQVMDRAFLPLRQRIRQTTERGFQYAVKDLPRGGKVNGTLAVAFDHLNPNIITALRDLDTDALDTLKEEQRATVKQAGEVAIQEGVGVKTFGRRIRDAVGLAPNQEQSVRNYEESLRTGDAEVLQRQLRDKRFDRTITKALDGDGLSEEQIARMTDAYRRRFIAHNANTHARTTTLQAYKAGQELTWKQAKENGVIPPNGRLMKTWIQIDRPTKRESHVPLHGETVSIDQPYSNGEMIP